MNVSEKDLKDMESEQEVTPGEYIADEIRRIGLVAQLHMLAQERGEQGVYLGDMEEVQERDLESGEEGLVSEKEAAGDDIESPREYLAGENYDADGNPYTDEQIAEESDVLEEEIFSGVLLEAVLRQNLAEVEARIESRNEPGSESGDLPIERLQESFGLSQLEQKILLICLAPALNLDIRRMYGVLNADNANLNASLQVINTLLGVELEDEDYAKIRSALSSRSTLVRNHLVAIKYRADGPDYALLSTPLVVDERIVDFLLGGETLDARTHGFLEFYKSESSGDATLENLHLNEELRVKLTQAVGHLKDAGTPALLFFYGTGGAGKKRAANALGRALDRSILKLNLAELLLEAGPRELLERVAREARLQNALLLIEDCDIIANPDSAPGGLLKALPDILRQAGGPVVFVSQEPLNLEFNRAHFWSVELEFPVISYGQRKIIWEQNLNGNANFSATLTPAALADRFSFTEGQIKSALALAENRADLGAATISEEDILAGCRAQSNRKLGELAKRIQPKFGWDDLILPAEKKQQLNEVQNHLRHREKVYTDWGYEGKIAAGRGLNVLFTGVSGTGKTMAASIIASGLGLELYKIDLSSVVSKYIGETEKNLSRIFHEAETANAVLFFDEADALFGKRSEVKDAHDRYANIEVGYLLQRMEEFRGMTILATNMSENMDKAFMRRLHFIVVFRAPDGNEREIIWQNAFPSGAPLADDIDYDFLGQKLKITGANIKNIALAAGFFAAETDEPIGMSHIMRATMREYKKESKPFLKEDLSPYHQLAVESAGVKV